MGGWKYTDGQFYVSNSGNGIFYIEVNPCGCCPHSYMQEYKNPTTGNKTTKYTSYFDEYTPNIKTLEKRYGLRKLE